MKTIKVLVVSLLCMISTLVYAQQGSTEVNSKKVITKKIMYDVQIVSNRVNEVDWFWQNMIENDLDQLLTILFDDVKNGIIQAYVYDYDGDYASFESIPKDGIKDYFEENANLMGSYLENDEETGSQIEVYAPYPAKKSYIQELRFLEEWYYEGDVFCKRVIAVAPIFVLYEGCKDIFYWVNIEAVN